MPLAQLFLIAPKKSFQTSLSCFWSLGDRRESMKAFLASSHAFPAVNKSKQKKPSPAPQYDWRSEGNFYSLALFLITQLQTGEKKQHFSSKQSIYFYQPWHWIHCSNKKKRNKFVHSLLLLKLLSLLISDGLALHTHIPKNVFVHFCPTKN